MFGVEIWAYHILILSYVDSVSQRCINIHFFRKWWYNEAIYELHCLIFRNATMLLHKNVLLLQCQEFLESWNRRLYLSHSQAPIDFKTLSLRVSKATGAWKLINLHFSDKIHEKFQEICPETGRNWYKWLSKYQNYFQTMSQYVVNGQILNQKWF